MATTTSAPAAFFPTYSMDQISRIYADSITAAATRPPGSLAALRLYGRARRAQAEALRRNFIVDVGFSGHGIYEKVITS